MDKDTYYFSDMEFWLAGGSKCTGLAPANGEIKFNVPFGMTAFSNNSKSSCNTSLSYRLLAKSGIYARPCFWVSLDSEPVNYNVEINWNCKNPIINKSENNYYVWNTETTSYELVSDKCNYTIASSEEGNIEINIINKSDVDLIYSVGTVQNENVDFEKNKSPTIIEKEVLAKDESIAFFNNLKISSISAELLNSDIDTIEDLVKYEVTIYKE